MPKQVELPREEWREVPDTGGRYSISNYGDIVDNEKGRPVKVRKNHVTLDCGNHKRHWRPDILTRVVFGTAAILPPRPPRKIILHSAVKPYTDDLPEMFDFELAKAEQKEKSEEWSMLRLYVLARDRHHCQRCETRVNLEIHHIIPRGLGGGDHPENLIALCRRCHDLVEANHLRTANLICNWPEKN